MLENRENKIVKISRSVKNFTDICRNCLSYVEKKFHAYVLL